MSSQKRIEILQIGLVIQLTSLSRSTIYRLIKKDDFPKPIRLSANRSGFRLSEIESWLESRPTTDLREEQNNA